MSERSGGAPTTRRVTVHGRQMVVDVYPGEGRPVLLLHGIPGWRGTWHGVASRLAGRHQVIVPDLLGFGESEPPVSHDFHARGQAEAVLGLLDSLQLGAAHVAGHDFGGPVALLLARMAPERVTSLALLATNAFIDTPIPVPLRVARVPLLGWIFFRMAFGRVGLMGAWLAATRDRVAFPFARYRRMLRFGGGVTWTRRIFYASLRDLPGLYGDVQQAIHGLSAPAVVLWGDGDPFFPVRVGQRTADAARATLHVLPGCGHFVPEERPAEVASRLEELYAR